MLFKKSDLEIVYLVVSSVHVGPEEGKGERETCLSGESDL